MSSIGVEFPEKPVDRCTLGLNIALLANHFSVQIPKEFTVHQYDVALFKGKELVESKGLGRKMFEKLVELKPQFAGRVFYDFKKLLFSLDELIEDAKEELTVTFETKSSVFLMIVKKTRSVSIGANVQDDKSAVQALQMMFTSELNNRSDLVPIQRSYYIKNLDRLNLGFNVDLWKGFFVSVRPSESGFNVNLDVANCVLQNETNLVELACQFFQVKNAGELGKVRWKDFSNYMCGSKVKIYLGYAKTVEAVGPENALHKIMVEKDEMTIADYFKNVKNIELKHPTLPCVNLGGKEFVILMPLELCKTRFMAQKNLTGAQTSQVITQTAIKPEYRRSNIQQRLETANFNNSQLLSNLGIRTNEKMSELGGKVLSAPDLQYHNQTVNSTNGSWDNRNKQFCNTVQVNKWIAISFGVKVHDDVLNSFLQSIPQVARKHGMQIKDPIDYVYGDPQFSEAQAIAFFKEQFEYYHNVEMFFVVLPGSTPIYSALKTFGDMYSGVYTQAIDENTIIRQKGRFDRLVSNVCMKINAKLGGRNFMISKNDQLFKKYLQEIYNGPLMVFGADVSHSTSLSKDATESIAAVVGSTDPECCYYAARIQAQQQAKGRPLETIYSLRTMVYDLLLRYFEQNKRFPAKLLFLRDGISEGQFKNVRDYEMNQIREACALHNAGYKPGVTYAVVQKRHHTRFFTKDKKDGTGPCGNVPPGTLVDQGIVTPDLFDFFLCSHMGIKGTSKPCRYFVLHDDNNFTVNAIAVLVHYLCHIYSRSTTSVSYPAPTYYADLLAERGRLYTRPPVQPDPLKITFQDIHVNELFRNKMFFI